MKKEQLRSKYSLRNAWKSYMDRPQAGNNIWHGWLQVNFRAVENLGAYIGALRIIFQQWLRQFPGIMQTETGKKPVDTPVEVRISKSERRKPASDKLILITGFHFIIKVEPPNP